MPDLQIAVTPRAHRDAIGPYRDGILEVRVARPPAHGEANRAAMRLVAGALALPPSWVTIVAGERARRKRLRIEGISAGELARRLAALDGD